MQFGQLKRREFITLIGGATAWPLAARAQPAAGTLRLGSVNLAPRSAPIHRAFAQRLAELGYQEGENFAFEFIQISSYEEYESGFRELVARKVDIIFHGGAELGLRWALKATNTLPIVIVATDYDPIAKGYVTSLARPTGNITGLFPQQIELAKKRLQILKEALPDLQAATLFWDASSEDQWNAISGAAREFRLRLAGVELRERPYDYEAALMQAPLDHRGALIVSTSPVFYADVERLAEFALRHRIASIFGFREWVEAGGFLSYGSNLPAMFRRAADYVDRIARGAKPADLPIEQPTKFELILNLKTARLIGITVPQMTLVRAEEVIE
jgi:putative tryptophan/tyrosine transport system substrate-binding protein